MKGKKVGEEEFMIRAKEKHGDRFDYSSMKYKNITTSIEIICKAHGSFWQKPHRHLRSQRSCPKCPVDRSSNSLSVDDFIERAIKCHGDRYEYNDVNYVDMKTKVNIFCKKHKTHFKQSPINHINNHGCPLCGVEAGVASRKITKEDFKKDAFEVHGDKYNYDLVDLEKGVNSPVDIVCPKHGVFNQYTFNHLKGHGCRECGNSLKGSQDTHWYYLTEDPAELYVIRLSNMNESFIKIGLSKNIHRRMIYLKYETRMDIEVIKTYAGIAKELYKAEQELLQECFQLSYEPNITFGGRTECFREEYLDDILNSVANKILM